MTRYVIKSGGLYLECQRFAWWVADVSKAWHFTREEAEAIVRGNALGWTMEECRE